MNATAFIILLSILFYLWLARTAYRSVSEQRRDEELRRGLQKYLNAELPPLVIRTPATRRADSGPPPEPPLRAFFREAREALFGLPVMRALVMKELRTLLASRKSFWLLFGLSLVGSGYFIIFWQNHALSVTIATRSQFSRQMFSSLFLVQYVGLGLISAVMASVTVTTERENKTLDILLSTRLTRGQVVLAKWFSNIIYQLVLYAALLPILALSFQLGGVGLDDYLAAALLVSAAIVTFGMLGLAISCYLQRTISALLAAAIATAVIGQFIPAHRFFDSGNSGLMDTIPYLFMLGLIFLIAWRSAWSGLARRDTHREAVATPLIHDERIIKQRRNTWPYYLIDPLARPQEIRDTQNPVYIKEQRVSLLGRLDVNIRLCYAAMFLSFILSLSKSLDGSFTTFRFIACWEISLIMLFVPVLAATSLSKEFEENTLGLLRATPLRVGQIVRAKYRIAMRFLTIVCLSMMVIPAAIHTGIAVSGNNYLRGYSSWVQPATSMLKITPLLLGWTALYAALSIFCSSLCRRNVTAIVSSYAAMLLLLASPQILGFLSGVLGAGGRAHGAGGVAATCAALDSIRYYLCPLLSPYFFYADGAGDAGGHFFSHWEDWSQIARVLALLGAAVITLIQSAKASLLLGSSR